MAKFAQGRFTLKNAKLVKYGKEKKMSKTELADLYKLIQEKPQTLKNGGMLGQFLNLNKAYWGRNWAENRKYSMHEIRDLGSSIYTIGKNPDRINTVMAKTGQLFHGLDWSDSIFGRLSQ